MLEYLNIEIYDDIGVKRIYQYELSKYDLIIDSK